MKRILRKAFVTIGILVMAIVMAVPASAAVKPKLNKTKAAITAGSSMKLKVKNTKKKVKWSSSNKKVAVVSSSGVVTAKKKGTATITAKVSGKKLKCKITVKAAKYVKKRVTWKNVEFYVVQKGDNIAYLKIRNKSGVDYSLGWTEGARITLVTTTGTYYDRIRTVELNDIKAGQTYCWYDGFRVSEATGTWKKLTISGILTLGANGFPVNAGDFTGDSVVIKF